MKIFNPLTKLFKINYKERLENSTEFELYEAKMSFIKALQQKQYCDNLLKYHAARVETLTELVETLKGPSYAKTNSITNVVNFADEAVGNRDRARLPNT